MNNPLGYYGVVRNIKNELTPRANNGTNARGNLLIEYISARRGFSE